MEKRKLLQLCVILSVGVGLFFAFDGTVHSQNSKSLIFNSKHDFTVQSAATIRSTTEDKACIFCHTPHNANPATPLWNHQNSNVPAYQLYSSTTLRATMSQMTNADSSKLCLSCHDGTIAMGDTINNGLIPFVQGSNYTLPPSSASNIHKGTGFADDHPFSFTPVVGSEVQNPPPNDRVRLDRLGKVQCSSCHDPHVENLDATMGKFLVKANLRSALCLSCHTNTGWNTSSHYQPASALDDARYTATQGAHTGYTGVANNGCESCHRPHTSAFAGRLQKFNEENACYKCHNGTVADSNKNIQAEFQNKIYRHPVNLTPSVHDASEGRNSASFPLPETAAGAARHVECADCHNSHSANAQTASPPSVSGALFNVKGFTSSGLGTNSAQFEYEICLKCHADSANKPQAMSSDIGFGRAPDRLVNQNNPSVANKRLEFLSSVSFHPVINPRGLSTGTNGEVPSLRTAVIGSNGQPLPGRPLSPGSLIYCSDCHNNNLGRNLGTGTAPAGTHGSNLVHLLERNYSYNTPPATPGGDFPRITYSTAAYALCDKCHDLNSIVNDRSFSEHRKHIVEVGASCSVCHDAHGINGGNTVNNSHLINFDLSIVAPNSRGLLEYRATGFRNGSCSLNCHGENHNAFSY
ncbi:MAG: cytochrome c3 family protein [Acidobacteriota bacterium]